MAKRLPLILTALGIFLMVGGIALLVLRLSDPQSTAELLFGSTRTPQPPTPASLFDTPLEPPPLNRENIVIMPVMEVAGMDAPTALPSLTATRTHTPSPTATLSLTPTIPSIVVGTSPTQTQPMNTLSPTPTHTLTPVAFITPTITPPPSPTPLGKMAPPIRLAIPTIDLTAPIEPVWLQQIAIEGSVYSQWRVPERRAIGWHETSAQLGEIGNTVLNGHHNQYGKVFEHLIDVQVGDGIRLEGADSFSRDYTVVQSLILAEEGQSLEKRVENARWLLPSHDERITLVTCWPPDGRTHRLVVIALPNDTIQTDE